MNLVIVNYGLGNVSSIHNMLQYLGIACQVSRDISVISKADKLILPGVGSFDNGMSLIEKNNLIDILNEKVLHYKTPVLGICLGMQLMCKHSEEGSRAGLNWISADVVRFSSDAPIRVPHMGWNSVCIHKNNPLLNSNEESYFYFVHAYHLSHIRDADILASTIYGYEFVSAIQHDNIFGVQFHPEKSHRFGMSLLKNFAELI